jgi:hypothetical protein
MVETAAHLIDQVIPRVLVRQWVLSFPIPLRFLFASHPHLLAPVLQVIHRVISTFLINADFKDSLHVTTGRETRITSQGDFEACMSLEP